MKHVVLFLIFFLPTFLSGQNSGEIIYEMTMDLHRRMTGDRAQFKDMVPQYRSNKSKLLFGDGQAVYQAIKEENINAEQAAGGRRMRFRMRNPDDIVWQNYQEGRRVEQRDFMDKKFLITGEPHKYPWKLTGETKQVGKYLCQQATYQDSTENVVAWFTPMVPVPIGPSRYGQLPGLILHIDINDGERTMTALEIKMEDVDASLISEPTKGKEISQEDFREIMEEKMKEMRAQRGGGPGMIIRRGN